MRSVNKVILLGTVGHNPTFKETANGQPFCRISIATDSWSPPSEDGVFAKKTSWHSVHAFGRQAELAQKFLSKGRKIFVEGKIDTLKSSSETGATWKTFITAEKLTFIEGPNTEMGVDEKESE